MDNDNKIKDAAASGTNDRKKEVRLFLEEELLPIEKSRQPSSSYDLEGEFAKTKKNKSFFIPLLMFACVTVVGFVTFLVARNVTQANERISVPADVFSDLDMGSLLKNRSSAEMHKIIAQAQLDYLERVKDETLEEARIRRDSDLYVLASMQLDSDTVIARTKITKKYTADVKAVHDTYDAAVSNAKKELQEVETELASYDKQIRGKSGGFADQVRQRERKLLSDSYDKILDSSAKDYEKLQRQDYAALHAAVSVIAEKYQKEVDGLDPVLSDGKGSAIIQKASEYSDIGKDNYSYLMDSLPKDELTDEFVRGMRNVSDISDSFSYINNTIASLPQKHSIPSYVKAEKQLLSELKNEALKAFTSQIDYIYTEFVNETKTNDELRKQIENLTEKNNDLQKRISDLDSENTNLEKQNADIQKRYDKLTNDYEAVSEWTKISNDWFEAKAQSDKVGGFILSINNKNEMNIYLTPENRALLDSSPEGQRAKIGHGWNKSVAEGIVSASGSLYYFTPGNTKEAEKIQEGDSINLLH